MSLIDIYQSIANLEQAGAIHEDNVNEANDNFVVYLYNEHRDVINKVAEDEGCDINYLDLDELGIYEVLEYCDEVNNSEINDKYSELVGSFM